MKRISTLLFTAAFLISQQAIGQCLLPNPSNFHATAINSCNVAVAWNAVDGTVFYKVKYKPNGQSDWITKPDHIMTTNFVVTGLNPATKYIFAVAAYCSNNRTGGWSQLKNIVTAACSAPLGINITNATSTSATVNWTPQCGSTNFRVIYKVTASTAWLQVTDIVTNSYTITGLNPATSYTVGVQSICGSQGSKWTSSVTFNTNPASVSGPPNILMIMLDDGRYDEFQPTGGPSWFPSPSINRIANEGANFVHAFATTAECAPSRVSFYTGLYAHHHGAIDNTTRMYDSLPLVSQILKDHGYYTGFVGKYGQFQGDPAGYDYWVTSDKNDYINTTYQINGSPDTVIMGHITDIYQTFAMQFLNSVPANKHFLLMFNTRIPHGPTIPRDQDTNLYLDDTMPFPDNFYQYTVNYPSYFYSTQHNWPYTAFQTDSMRLLEFQCLAGLEENVTTFMTWLEDHGILDSTMIIFTSDNGFLKGEHMLQAKLIAQEQSIQIPMFVRYPAWFAPGTVYTDKLVANIDVAPTILDAAGIPETYNMDGLSLKKLVDNEVQRNYFFYQYAGEVGDPTLRSIRSRQYKYVKHYCNTITEEFYNLVSDPEEDTNQINNSAYAALIQSYRTKLDSMRNAVGDYTPVTVDCYLSNPQFGREEDIEHEESSKCILKMWPNPATDNFIVNFNDTGNKEDITIQVSNIVGEVIYTKKIPHTDILNNWISSAKWPPGVYIVNLFKGTRSYSDKLIVGK